MGWRILLTFFLTANVAVGQASSDVGSSSGPVRGSIQNDLTVDSAYAVAYRNVGSTPLYDFLISASITKSRALGRICFTFGNAGTNSADPTRSFCESARQERFTQGLWLTTTNHGCSPSQIAGSTGRGCERIHIFAVNDDGPSPIYTRLTQPIGIETIFTNRGADSALSQIPAITRAQYTVSNQAAFPNSTIKGRFRIHANNLNASLRYALLVDGIPYANNYPFVVSAGRPTITAPATGGGFFDLPGYSLAEGSYTLQLVEYQRAPSFRAGPNVFSDALRPFPGPTSVMHVTKGYHFSTCNIQNPAMAPTAQCFVLRGMGEESFPMNDCSTSSSGKFCSTSFTSNAIGSTTIIPLPHLQPSVRQNCGRLSFSDEMYFCNASFQ